MNILRITTLSIIPIIFLLNSCNFEVTTSNVSEIRICEDLSGNLCGEDQTALFSNAPQICASCNLNNAPSNTLVTFTWKYMEEPQLVIDEVTINNTDDFKKAIIKYRWKESVVILLQRGGSGYYITLQF